MSDDGSLDAGSSATRRGLLAAAAAGGLATLAGCTNSVLESTTTRSESTERTAASEDSTANATSTPTNGELLTSFERSDLEHWTAPEDGPTDRPPVVSQRWASIGSRSLALTASRGSENNAKVRSAPGDGLEAYPTVGDVVAWRFVDDTAARGGYEVLFGASSSPQYTLEVQYTKSELRLLAGDETETTAELDLEPSTVYRAAFEWGIDRVSARVYDGSRSVLADVQLPVVDDVAAGGIAFRRWVGGPTVRTYTDEVIRYPGAADGA